MDRTERFDRLRKVLTEIDGIMREVGPKLIRAAHLREEARSIISELDGRDPVVQGP